MQQQFFQAFGPGMQSGFFGPGAQMVQNEQPVPEYITYNEVLLEVANNWPFVRWMMDRHRHGELKQVDQMEQLWLNFIVQQNINIESFKNNEDFIKTYWKNPVI